MKDDFLKGNAKGAYENLVRTCGFGVPDIGRALWSASNTLSRPNEDVIDFRQRINQRARDEEDDLPYIQSASDDRWLIGMNARHKGSLHSDVWRGPASDLAGLGILGVYPAPGWWKTLVSKNRFDDKVRYSLVVSIKTQQTEVDLYNAVATEIQNRAVVTV